MAWYCDKYTSWHVPCINVILDLDLDINIVLIQDELDPCTKNCNSEITIAFAIKQIGYGWSLLLTYTLTRVIVLEATIYVYVSK